MIEKKNQRAGQDESDSEIEQRTMNVASQTKEKIYRRAAAEQTANQTCSR